MLVLEQKDLTICQFIRRPLRPKAKVDERRRLRFEKCEDSDSFRRFERRLLHARAHARRGTHVILDRLGCRSPRGNSGHRR
ncbi:MAG: hypothetical protein DME33_09395 [Verrucomicrobia bacterium]|nr:MAG: hypothetical protein DME33_09395 [Verrucomicrobiota bacterium]